MLDEDQADNVMSDIHYMTQQGWTDMLQHIYELHRMRDYELFAGLAEVYRDSDDWDSYFDLRRMNYGY